MQGIGSVFVRLALATAVIALIRTGCRSESVTPQNRTIQLSQSWELQPGNRVAGYRVSGGLGDISIKLKGQAIYAPFSGLLQPYQDNCVLFSTDEVPAYLFRLCGIRHPKVGDIKQGELIGSGDYLEFAALRKQPNGTWAFVEPSRNILERTLKQP